MLDVVRGAEGAVESAAGGSPANVAVGLARLGGATTLVTQLADDGPGHVIATHVEASGAELAVDDSAVTTSSAVATLDEHGSASYAFDIRWSLDRALAESVVDALRPAHVHAGSLATVLEPGASAVRAVVERHSGAGTVSYDPNIRTELGSSMDEARAAVEWFVDHADVVKASDEDIALIHPGVDALDVAREWSARRPAVVVVTRGEAGSVLLASGVESVIPGVRTTVADTVGAGDSYMAALIDGLDRAGVLGDPAGLAAVPHAEIARLAERAARAAAITVSRRGAEPPTAAELDSAASPDA